MIKETVISAIIFMIRHDNGDVLVVFANVEFRQEKGRKNVILYLFFACIM